MKKKDRISILESQMAVLSNEIRDIQDALYELQSESAKVPVISTAPGTYTVTHTDGEDIDTYIAGENWVKLIHDTCVADIQMDDNFNVTYRWKFTSGAGGEVKLPVGSMFVLPEMLTVLHMARGNRLFDECKISGGGKSAILFKKEG